MASAYPASLSAARMKKRASEWDTEGLVAKKDTTGTSARVARSATKTDSIENCGPRMAHASWAIISCSATRTHAQAMSETTSGNGGNALLFA